MATGLPRLLRDVWIMAASDNRLMHSVSPDLLGVADLSTAEMRRARTRAEASEPLPAQQFEKLRDRLDFLASKRDVPCFTPGTVVATPRGEVPVEYLRPGDKVVTRDNGLQEIRWCGAIELCQFDMHANPHLRPILIRQGSLGNGLPERDILVSPNHRVLVANERTSLYFDEHEVLVAAKHLVGAKGISQIDSAGTTYLHFMFDRHQVVLSNGSWTESFQVRDYTLRGLGNAQRTEIFELFPELQSADGVEAYSAARRVLQNHEARLLLN
jgi:hypothetical protein